MRNIFDQYKSFENRLTHALASGLSQDRKLLTSFFRDFLKTKAPKSMDLDVLEQRLPGQPQPTEQEALERGLPDIWIHDKDSWCLLVESKVASSLSRNQLLKHHRTAVQRGFTEISVLAIDSVPARKDLPSWCFFRQWSDVYVWLKSIEQASFWSREIARFLEISESEFIESGYMKTGNLTTFSGIPFDDENPYNYLEAKRVLGLAMNELRKDSDLSNRLKIDMKSPGRGAITGRGTSHVWDLLRFQGVSSDFGKEPHLVLAIDQDAIRAHLSIPNRLSSKRRNRLLSDFDQFQSLIQAVTDELVDSLGSVPGFKPKFLLLQRHYPSQRSVPVVDGKIEFDMRAEFKDLAEKYKIKYQPHWLPGTYSILANRKSNIYVGIGAEFPYHYCRDVRTPKILKHIAKAWISTGPILEMIVHN